MNKQHLLVIDPTSYRGGSKIATENILSLVDQQHFQITVLSSDTDSWQQANIKQIKLVEMPWLAKQEKGIPYFLRHLWISMMLLLVQLRLGRVDIAIGASGPGVDLSLYFVKVLCHYRLVQLIHGPIARSKTIAKCLSSADHIFYLESVSSNILDVLSSISGEQQSTLPDKYQLFENGLTQKQWPSVCQYNIPTLFWAASLLKWKGLDLFIEALESIDEVSLPHSHICYIKPKDTILPISEIKTTLPYSHWYQAPNQLDHIRAGSNIFVSTSNKEPFGLSVLEAMASGHALLIPNDGAYWDRKLVDGKHCLKYQANDAIDLAKKIKHLAKDINLIKQLGKAAFELSQTYQAENCYQAIVEMLDNRTNSAIINGNLHA